MSSVNSRQSPSCSHFGPKVVQGGGNCVDRLRTHIGECTALTEFLREAAGDAQPALLTVNDSHRATLTREALLVLTEMVNRHAPRARFRVLVACGTHEFDEAEMRRFEQAMLDGVGLCIEGIEWHQARTQALHRSIGKFEFHHRLWKCRYLLPIGSVEPHYFAGVTGPHKTVTIGCMSHEGIRHNHQGALDPASDILRLTGNPIHEGVLAALEALTSAGKSICCIGEVACGADLVAAATGDPITTVNALLPAAVATFVHVIQEPFDLLHLKVPLPLGRSLYQADKAIKNNHRAVRNGGGIILEAPCPDGVGASAFLNLLRKAPTLAAARSVVEKEGYILGDHKAIKLRELTDTAGRGVSVALVSNGINAADARAAGMTLFAGISAAREWLQGKLSAPIEREAVIDDAGFVTVAPSAV